MCLIAFDWRPAGADEDVTNTIATATVSEATAAAARDNNLRVPKMKDRRDSDVDTSEILRCFSPRLVLAANRDEYYDRPSQPAQFWNDHDLPQQHVYGGRDLLLGGTWLCCSTHGRFAAVTNFHEEYCRNGGRGGTRSSILQSFPRSRGEILKNFVCSSSPSLSAKEFAQELEHQKDLYAGFTLLLFDGESLVCCTNRDPQHSFLVRELPAGVYGLSNHLLDTPWPKVLKAKESLSNTMNKMKLKESSSSSTSFSHQELATMLIDEMHDGTIVIDQKLLPTTLDEWEEKIRSAVFVQGPDFGTRTTTIVTFDDKQGFEVTEKNYETPFSRPSLSYAKIPPTRLRSERMGGNDQ